MISTLFLLLFFYSPNLTVLQFDFGNAKDGKNWVVVNDGVMGGRSLGNAFLNDDSILFQGSISFDNNGGFASVRSSRMRLDVSDSRFIEIRYRSSGVAFSLMLEQSSRFYIPYYSYPLETTQGEWVTKLIPIESLKETRLGDFTGRTLDKEKSKPIIRLGFISRDKKEASFELEIDYLLMN